MSEQYNPYKRDHDAASKRYRKMSEFRHPMFDLWLSDQSQIDPVLAKRAARKVETRLIRKYSLEE